MDFGVFLIRRTSRDDDDDDDDGCEDTPIYEEWCKKHGCLRKVMCWRCHTCRMHCTCFKLAPEIGMQEG